MTSCPRSCFRCFHAIFSSRRAQEKLNNKEKELLKKWFDNGMWFDALMNADHFGAWFINGCDFKWKVVYE